MVYCCLVWVYCLCYLGLVISFCLVVVQQMLWFSFRMLQYVYLVQGLFGYVGVLFYYLGLVVYFYVLVLGVIMFSVQFQLWYVGVLFWWCLGSQVFQLVWLLLLLVLGFMIQFSIYSQFWCGL